MIELRSTLCPGAGINPPRLFKLKGKNACSWAREDRLSGSIPEGAGVGEGKGVSEGDGVSVGPGVGELAGTADAVGLATGPATGMEVLAAGAVVGAAV